MVIARPTRAPSTPRGSRTLGVWQCGHLGRFLESIETEGEWKANKGSQPEGGVAVLGELRNIAPSAAFRGVVALMCS